MNIFWKFLTKTSPKKGPFSPTFFQRRAGAVTSTGCTSTSFFHKQSNQIETKQMEGVHIPTLSRPLSMALQQTANLNQVEDEEVSALTLQVAPAGSWFASPMPSPNPDQLSSGTLVNTNALTPAPTHPTLPRNGHEGIEGYTATDRQTLGQTMGQTIGQAKGALGLSMLDLNLGLGLVHHSIDNLDYDNAPTFADTLPPTPTVLDSPPLIPIVQFDREGSPEPQELRNHDTIMHSASTTAHEQNTARVTFHDVERLKSTKDLMRLGDWVLASGNAILLGPLATRSNYTGQSSLDEALEKQIMQEWPSQPIVQNKADGGWYEFRIAAACRPKNPRGNDKLPDICKVDAGEDAYFVQNGGESLVLGVADGVGGWTSLGVDPSLFAWDLMNCCTEVAEQQASLGILDTSTCLSEGYRRVKDEGRVEAGSSTACLVGLDKRTGHLHTTNLGDSGAIVIRPSPPPPGAMLEPTDPPLQFHIPFRTTDLQHYFNAPFQLSVLPPPMREDPTNIVDSPADAVNEEFGGDPTHGGGVKEGDVIVVGTDGVWDNLWEEEIVDRLRERLGGLGDGWIPLQEGQSTLQPASAWHEVEDDEQHTLGYYGNGREAREEVCDDPTVSAATASHPAKMSGYEHVPSEQIHRWRMLDQRLKRVAAQLCVDARDAAKNARKPSPFARNARRAGHLHFGGKLDDVTVVLAYVVRVPPRNPNAMVE
jgi:hypothetical protein